MSNISELRQDLVTGEWVVVATGRARRPGDFALLTHHERPQPKRGCPFEQLSETALAVYDRSGKALPLVEGGGREFAKSWWVEVIPNLYPAFGHGICAVERQIGPYRWQDGAGFHEIVVTRDHARSIAAMRVEEVIPIISAYRDRYLALKDDTCVQYISIFHNHGREAGASISHPHSQIIAIPVVPPDIGRSLAGSAAYAKRTKRCVHCAMLDFEKKEGTRIIYQNRDFMMICPFVSRQAFEVRIFPKRHYAAFETIPDREIRSLADVLQKALAKLKKALRDPAYNFFIHTAPNHAGAKARHYHWHVEIIPKTAIWAGFEIGTGIEISTISPESAAKFLRSV